MKKSIALLIIVVGLGGAYAWANGWLQEALTDTTVLPDVGVSGVLIDGSDLTKKGVNICLKYNGAKKLTLMVLESSGGQVPAIKKYTVDLAKKKGVELMCKSVSSQLHLSAIAVDSVFLKHTNAMNIAGNAPKEFDGKIGGITNSPFFIGVEDVRGGVYDAGHGISSLMVDPITGSYKKVRIHWDPDAAGGRELIISSDYLPPLKSKEKKMKFDSIKVARWDCDFSRSYLAGPKAEDKDQEQNNGKPNETEQD